MSNKDGDTKTVDCLWKLAISSMRARKQGSKALWSFIIFYNGLYLGFSLILRYQMSSKE